MYLRDLAVYAEHAISTRFPSGFVGWFHRESCCITELYVSLLSKSVATSDTAKVNLTFTEIGELAPTLRQLINVADARWPFAFTEYAKGCESEKKRMMLDGLHSALVWIGNERAWDVCGFRRCYDEVVRRNLTFSGWSKKSWASPNRRHRARVGFFWGLRSVDFFVGAFDTRGREIGRKALRSVVPEMGVAHSLLKGLGIWQADGTFRLVVDGPHVPLRGTWEADLSDLVAGEKSRPRKGRKNKHE